MAIPKPTDKRLEAARRIAEEIGGQLDTDISVRLWDGSFVPLGPSTNNDLAIAINSPGTLTSLLRWPSLDRLIRHYAHGRIDVVGGTVLDLGERFASADTRRRLKQVHKLKLLRLGQPLLFGKADRPDESRGFMGDEVGAQMNTRDETKFIQFHYDVSNEFYELFLDKAMIYTCGYFTDWSNSLDQAQQDKLEMICRKLRLAPGERMLDIGCGWGGLICYAAKNFGVSALGVTLSREQYDLAQAKISAEGLSDKVEVRLQNYLELNENFDKISSIGMYEAIGVKAYPTYFAKIRSLLKPDGLFLNHGITRRGKRRRAKFSSRPEQRALLKYIFPGGELDDIGNTVQQMEIAGFEVHDVEGWREHYALTTRLWCERLTSRKEEAIALVGAQTYRIWVAYLAGCSLAFSRGSARIFQVVASRSARGASPLPPTRADLYRQ
ncbi:MAG: class I SAM-dependent methyltransferase [Hyphomicrobiaceae bacterium]